MYFSLRYISVWREMLCLRQQLVCAEFSDFLVSLHPDRQGVGLGRCPFGGSAVILVLLVNIAPVTGGQNEDLLKVLHVDVGSVRGCAAAPMHLARRGPLPARVTYPVGLPVPTVTAGAAYLSHLVVQFQYQTVPVAPRHH